MKKLIFIFFILFLFSIFSLVLAMPGSPPVSIDPDFDSVTVGTTGSISEETNTMTFDDGDGIPITLQQVRDATSGSTDDQTIDSLSLGGTTLSISLEDDGEASQTVDLAGLQDGANVATNLSEGTSTETTVDVNSSDGTNATLGSASTSRAGLLTKAKWDEIVANSLKATDTFAASTGANVGAKFSGTGAYIKKDGTSGDPSGSGDVTAAAVIGNDKIVTGDGGAKGVQEKPVAISDSGVIAINEEFTLPNTDGGAGTALLTNGSGAVTFVDVWTEAENTSAGYWTEGEFTTKIGAAYDTEAELAALFSAKQADLVVPSQVEAEAGTATDERVWTSERVGQAIAAQAGSGAGDVSKVGTPSNHDWGVWTGPGTLKGLALTSSMIVVTDSDGEPASGGVTTGELAELETIGASTLSEAQWAGLGGATTAGIALWDDADTSAQRTTLGLAIGVNVAAPTRKLDDFGTPDDNTTLNATTTYHGLCPKLGGGTTNFLRADGSWAVPSGAAHDVLTLGVSLSSIFSLTDQELGLTAWPTFNQNTSGTAANLSGIPALPDGTTATTQSASDNSTKLATTAYADAAGGGSGSLTTIKENDTGVGGADIITLDFLGADFDLAETPDTEIQVIIAAAILRDAEINSAANLETKANLGAYASDIMGCADQAALGALIPTLNQNTTGSAATLTILDNEATNENNAILFTSAGDLDGGNLGIESDGDLYYNPSTGVLYSAGGFGVAASTNPYSYYNETDGMDWWTGIDDTGNSFEWRNSETVGTSVQMELDEDGDLHLIGDLFITGSDADPSAAGQFRYDSTITGLSGGGLRWYESTLGVRLIVDLDTDPADDDYVVSYDADADKFYMKVDATGGTLATADISDVSVTQTEFAELETLGDSTISANQWAMLGGVEEGLTSTELNLLDGITTLSGSNTGDDDVPDAGDFAAATDLDLNGALVANAVDNAAMADNAIDTAELAADAVEGTKIADDQVDSEHYVAASIDNEHLADDAVGSAEIATDAVIMDGLDADGNFTSLTGNWRTTGIIQGRAMFATYSSAQILTFAANGGGVAQMTVAGEVTMWDATASNIGDFVTLWARDAEKIEVIPVSGDHFVLLNGTAITADYELDMVATAGTKITLMVTALNTWSIFSETATSVDGGVAD